MRTIGLALAFAAAACTSSHDERRANGSDQSSVYYHGQGPYERVAEDDYVMTQAEVLANEREHCCDEAELPSSKAYEQAIEQFKNLTLPDPASGARYDPAAAGACLSSLKERGCALGKAVPEGSEACRSIYSGGRRKLGESCRSSWDCARHEEGTVYCLADGTRHEDVCTLFTDAAEGDDCTDPRTGCKGPMLCDPVRGVCVQPAKLGEPCVTGPSLGDTCRAGAVCDRNGSKRCVKPKAVGEQCEALEECEYLACIDGVCRKPLSVVDVCR